MTEALKDLPNVVVDWAMRYGQPSIASKIDALKEQGCEKSCFSRFIRNMPHQPRQP